MNIIEVMKIVGQESKIKIKRDSWYFLIYWDAEYHVFRDFNTDSIYTITILDILANDWEVVE